MLYRKMSMLVGVLALGLYLAGSGLQAQEKQTQQRPGSTTGGTSATAAQGHTWQGRISNVDSAKREITLNNVKRLHEPGTKTGTAPGTSGATTRPAPGSTTAGTEAKGTMTFMVSPTAKITLDGKTATLSELKSGEYARVSSKHAENKTGSSKSDTSGKSGTSGAGSSATNKAHHTVDRVEAFTKEPASAGTRPGAIK